jgi:hypothetical protein
VQHPAAELFDQVAFFGDGDEATRQNQAAFRMRPAHQGFDPDDPVIGEINARLVMTRQGFCGDGAAQTLLDIHPFGCPADMFSA